MPDQVDVTGADVIVIGMGSGGEDVGGRLAEAGLTVIGIESSLVGGECPYWGCIPSKMMIRAANLLQEGRRVNDLAGSATVEPDWGPVARRIREQATGNWDDTVAVERFESKGGHFVRGRGRIVGPGRVAVDDREFAASRGIVIATGTTPAVPPIPGLAETDYWTNHDAIEVEELPSSLIVLGAGAIGSELAQVFSRFGVDVTQIEALDRMVPHEEPEAGEVLQSAFEGEGIAVHTGARAEKVIQGGDGIVVSVLDGTDLTAERLLVAAGRATDLAGLGAAEIGIDVDAKFVEVDDHMRAGEGVWAVGDATGAGLFTHIALYQSRIAVADILGEEPTPADYAALTRVTFTDPEIGAVGLSEATARDQGIDVATATKRVDETARGWIHGTGNEGVIKLVVDRERRTLVGATSVGPHGGEVLSMLALAVHAQVTVDDLRRMIYAYPTFHKGVEDALGELDL
jgi:pyruvate/2-oxoglutarate dehydrogenase complex dihydrolipoamide dehydrogenase (E3) component